MSQIINLIGGFIRWLVKGCTTNLFKEINYDKNYHKNWLCLIYVSIILTIIDILLGILNF